jgi:heat shock protein HtpX
MSIFRTTILMALLTVLFIFLGDLIAGRSGATMALIFAGLMNFISYYFSDKIVLMMYRAQEIRPGDVPRLYRIVERLAMKAGLPMPKVYIIEDASPNAFATGRNPSHAAVAATTGILNLLDDRELEGVIGHELAHIRHRDILIGSIAATIAGAITWLAHMAQWGAMFGGLGGRDDEEGHGGNIVGLLFMAILAPIAAMLIQMAISRSREYAADRGGAEIGGNPLSLANALRKLHAMAERVPMESASPATAHMFIVNPLSGRSFASLFSTHPPAEERIARLEAMVG